MAGTCEYCGAVSEHLVTCDACGASICPEHRHDHGCEICSGGQITV